MLSLSEWLQLVKTFQAGAFGNYISNVDNVQRHSRRTLQPPNRKRLFIGCSSSLMWKRKWLVVLKLWRHGVVLLDSEKRAGGKWLWKSIRKYKYISSTELTMAEEERSSNPNWRRRTRRNPGLQASRSENFARNSNVGRGWRVFG